MDALANVLSRVKRREPAVVASVASVAALLVVLKWASRSKPEIPFVTNFAKVASKEGEEAREEYDVIVVGGGVYFNFYGIRAPWGSPRKIRSQAMRVA